MMVIRDSHAVTVMDSGEFSDYCDVTTGTSTAITTPNSDGGKSYVQCHSVRMFSVRKL